MFLRCQLQFQYRYLDGKIRPPGVALLVGSTVHKAAEVNLLAKRDDGAALPTEAVQDLAAMEFDRQWSEAGDVALDEDERGLGFAAVKGAAKDESVRLTGMHSLLLVPSLDPLHVEKSVRVAVPGLSLELEGTFDLVTKNRKVHDLKTSGKRLSADSITSSVQMRLYDLLYSVETGERPKALALDVVQKTKKADAYIVESGAFASHDPILEMAGRVERGVKSGVFQPASPDHWACGPSYCGYYNECPFGARARVTIPVS